MAAPDFSCRSQLFFVEALHCFSNRVDRLTLGFLQLMCISGQLICIPGQPFLVVLEVLGFDNCRQKHRSCWLHSVYTSYYFQH